VAVDLYRDARIKDRFTGLLRRFFAHGRPVVIAEFGCCTYRGAADAGGMGWAIVDLDIAELGKRPPRLNGQYVRDETEQAQELTDLLRIFDTAGVDRSGRRIWTYRNEVHMTSWPSSTRRVEEASAARIVQPS